MIPVSAPKISANAKKYILDCITTGWVSSKGTYVERFEQAFATFIGTKYAVATNSGTSALHLALAANNIGAGDEVLLPTLTMIASVLPVLYLGAKPVFVDSEKETGNIDINAIEHLITKRTKAIIAVHLHGHPANMAAISAIAKKHHLAVIEDAAEAHGAKIGNRMVGSFGQSGCFSFYGNKIITTGEGGMITTNSKTLDTTLRSLRNLARTPGKHFLHTRIAYAYRLSNLQAALGLAQVEEAHKFIAIKKHIAAAYTRSLRGLPGIILPTQLPGYESVYWQYGIVFNNSKLRYRIEKKLLVKNIETRQFFVPLHLQPALINDVPNACKKTYPIAESLAARGLCLPSGLTLTDTDIATICSVIKRSLS